MIGEVIFSSTENLFSWAKGNSLWTFSLGLSCCNLEFMAETIPKYDWERFGALSQNNHKNADLLIVAGPVTKALSSKIKEVYNEMLQPKYVISMGSCANTGGMFSGHSCTVVKGIDTILPVDVYVPGCPPRPEALIHGLLALQRKIFNKKR